MNQKTSLFLVILSIFAISAVGCDGGEEAPAPPTVDAVSSPTNENPITLTGEGVPGGTLSVRGGAGSPAQAEIDGDGRFEVEVMLREGMENILLVSQTVGGLESEAVEVRVVHDVSAPDAPTLDSVVSPTRRPTQRLRGQTEAGFTVRISGGAEEASGEAGEDGRFSILVELMTDATDVVDNVLSAVAVDLAGNESEPAMATIRFDPNLPISSPELDDFPGFTNEASVTLMGEADPEVGVSIVGGAADASGMADEDGAFAIEVTLRENQENVLQVFAFADGVTSSPATARIVHDDIAPEAPRLDPQASPTGAETIRLTGTSESFANVVVSGGAAEASGAADDFGEFAIDVDLTLDAVNTLSVVAIDRAGNESDPTEFAIEQDSSLEAPIIVDPVSSPTADPTVTLTGLATAETTVRITGGEDTVETMSEADGSWSLEVTLRANTSNELRVTRPGSGVETVVTIVHDDIPPDPPMVNEIPSPTASTTLSVSGRSEPFARISISGGVASANGTALGDGRFSIDVTIAEDAETTLSILATDRAGNVSSPPVMVSVTHSSDEVPAPILDQPSPPDTNEPTHVVEGRVAEPGEGVTVHIVGGLADVMGDSDSETGRFSIEVELNPNDLNTLVVTSMIGAIESLPANVTITHDDIPPDAADAGLITASSGAALTCGVAGVGGGSVSGAMASVEGNATVLLTNVTQGPTASTTATANGAFSSGLRSCAGNVIRVVVRDAAGNESDATEVIAE